MSDIRRVAAMSEVSSPSTEEIALVYDNSADEIKAIDSDRNYIGFPSSNIFGNGYQFDKNVTPVIISAIDPARDIIYSNIFAIPEIGIYKFNVRFGWSYDQNNKSGFFDWFVDGNLAGNLVIEPSDTNNENIFVDFDCLNMGAVGNVTLEIKGAKESMGGLMQANNFKSEVWRVL